VLQVIDLSPQLLKHFINAAQPLLVVVPDDCHK
jgi:hypothetical protein